MRRLKITAHLENGFSTTDPWAPSIDSILAAIVINKEIGREQYRIDQALGTASTAVELPLRKVGNKDWYWACSVPIYETQSVIVRSYYKKFNIDTAMMLPKKTKKIELTKNQFKNHSKTFRQIMTDKIEWVADGDAEKIETLLSDCTQVGGMRGKGMGIVKRWGIYECEEDIIRWIPVDSLNGGQIMYRGFRPCFRLKENQHLCKLGTLRELR